MADASNPFDMELLKNALITVADDMALSICRTARSFVIKEALDFSTALFDANGRMIAQGTCLPLHLGGMPAALTAILNVYDGRMKPGDIFCTNDPYDGSTHLPDIVCIKPAFLRETLIGYTAVLAHMTDIGGRVAAGNASDSTEIYQEGLRIPPSPLVLGGEPNETLFRIVERNVRVPDLVLGDIRSQIAACELGERGLAELVDRYGQDRFETLCTDLLNYTERFTRSEIAALPDGTYLAEDYLDDDGLGSGRITIRATIAIAGDAMEINFAGTSDQVKGAINCVYAYTASAAWAAVRSILDLSIPNNDGYFRAITVRAPEGSIVNPLPPAAVAARGLTGFRVADAVFAALAQVVPDKVPACGSSTPDTAISVGGYDADRNPFVYIEFLLASWGGGPDRDGMDACTGLVINYSNTPCEMVEAEQPLRVERYGFVPDSGGAGQFRGGLALERHVRTLADETVVQIRSDRRDAPPPGLHGGAAGAPSSAIIIRKDGTAEEHPTKFITHMHAGDVIRLRLAGGGGYGDPLSRDADAVAEDVESGKLTREAANQDYGVVIDPTGQADPSATDSLRQSLREAP